MFGRGSPKLNLMSKVSQRKNSPKVQPSKDCGSTSLEKTRAAWNPVFEKTLVDLLHEHNTPEYRGQNGWSSEALNKIVKEFLETMKGYKILKQARKQSGASWNNERGMIVAEPAVWANIIKSEPNAKRFHKKPFPLFEALGELHDGNTAEEGTYNFTSTQLHNPPEMIPDESDDESERVGVMPINLEERTYPRQDEETTNDDDETSLPRRDASVIRNKEPTNEDEGTSLPRRASVVTRNKEPKESKRQKKSSNIEAIMKRYVDIKAKQIESQQKKRRMFKLMTFQSRGVYQFSTQWM